MLIETMLWPDAKDFNEGYPNYFMVAEDIKYGRDMGYDENLLGSVILHTQQWLRRYLQLPTRVTPEIRVLSSAEWQQKKNTKEEKCR